MRVFFSLTASKKKKTKNYEKIYVQKVLSKNMIMMKLYVIIQEFDFFTDVHIMLKNNKKMNIKKILENIFIPFNAQAT